MADAKPTEWDSQWRIEICSVHSWDLADARQCSSFGFPGPFVNSLGGQGNHLGVVGIGPMQYTSGDSENPVNHTRVLAPCIILDNCLFSQSP